MIAKEYLQSIFFLDSKIDSNKERVKTFKESAENKTSKLSANKVQTSSSKQKMADAVCSYSDIEKMIKADEKKKQEIIDTISLLSPYESVVLYKCYVNKMTLKETARNLDRSYSWASKMHSSGIRNIQKILDNKGKAEV